MIIEVTQEDIDNGKPADGSCCAVARALHRATGNDRLYVRCSEIVELTEIGKFGRSVASLPKDVQDFIQRFDNLPRMAIKPTKFDIKLPS